MALTDFLIGRPPEYDHENDPLAKPFPGESEDLAVHAEVCARRYGKIMQGQAKSDLANYDLKVFIAKVAVAVLAGYWAVEKAPAVLAELIKVM